jgi:hypothetical protein
MRNLRTSVHCLPLEPGLRHALQNDSGLPDLRKDAQRMPNVPPRPRVPPSNASPRYRAQRDERGTDERDQSRVLRAESGGQGALVSGRKRLSYLLNVLHACSLLGVRTG